MAVFPRQPHTVRGDIGAPGCLFYKGTNLIPEDSALVASSPSKGPHLLVLSHWWLRFQQEFGGDKQSIAERNERRHLRGHDACLCVCDCVCVYT